MDGQTGRKKKEDIQVLGSSGHWVLCCMSEKKIVNMNACGSA